MNNQKKTTIYDIAKEAGVSASTVSRVINHPSSVSDVLREKVNSAMERMNFDLEMSKHKNYVKSGIILLIYPVTDSWFVAQYADLLRSDAKKDNRMIVLLALPDKTHAKQAFEEAVAVYRPIGIYALMCAKYDFLEKTDVGVPIIYLCDVPENSKYPTLDYDTKDVMQKGIMHLKSRGCKNIVYLCQPLDLSYTDKQLDAVIDALRSNKLYTATNIITLTDTSKESVREAASGILSRKYLPDAVFCSNDFLAVYFMKLAMEAGISVPVDMLVMGVGNTELSKYSIPSLTTFSFSLENITYSAYQLLNESIQDHKIPPKHMLLSDAELILRESTSRMQDHETEKELPTDYTEAVSHLFSSIFRRRK